MAFSGFEQRNAKIVDQTITVMGQIDIKAVFDEIGVCDPALIKDIQSLLLKNIP